MLMQLEIDDLKQKLKAKALDAKKVKKLRVQEEEALA